MEMINLGGLLQIFSSFGPFGIILIVWYLDSRAMRKILDQYKDDMAETRRMYENNVKLVEGYQYLSGDLKDLIILSTQHLQKLTDQIAQNQYCPMQRVEKKTIEVAG